MKTLRDRYDFFREHGNTWVGHSAETAMRLARAEERAEREEVKVVWEDECEPWDGEGPAPKYLMWAHVSQAEHVASLGMIGVNSMRDPYLRVVEAELCANLFDYITEQTARDASNARIRDAYAPALV